MYKNIRNRLILVIIVALFAVYSLILLSNNIAWDRLSNNYIESKQEIVDYYIEKNINDLANIIESNAVWTEAVEALESKESDWLYDNATGYIIDETSFNVDGIIISSEDQSYVEYYGELSFVDIKSFESFNQALLHNKSTFEMVWLDDEMMLIYASPFYTNEAEDPTGCYLAMRLFASDELLELQRILGDEEVESIELSQNKKYKTITSDGHHYIKVSMYLEEHPVESFLNVDFEVEMLDYIFNRQMLAIVVILAFAALIVVFVIISYIKKAVIKLTEVISTVESIAVGNYNSKLKPINSKMLIEVDNLIKSVNRMSTDIEEHIDTVDEHAKVIDKKYFEMIRLLVDVVEMNDTYTYHHSFSVSQYARLLGEVIGFEHIDDLVLASKLHDVGKIAIPSEILNKPGKLTDEEYQMIQTHSAEGDRLLKGIDMFDHVRLGVRHHHERYDGKGYPDGLVGDEIPMIAQIISVADVFEAVTSDRSYRKALTNEEALAILLDEKGKMFNPELVDVFHHSVYTKVNELQNNN